MWTALNCSVRICRRILQISMVGERCVRINDIQINVQQYAGTTNSAAGKYMSKLHKNIRNME